jgi:hypothetical protein
VQEPTRSRVETCIVVSGKDTESSEGFATGPERLRMGLWCGLLGFCRMYLF